MKNFFSFREETSIPLRLDANCPPQIALGRRCSPVMCIKGANGSGKTQVLKALSFLGHFCSDSFGNKPDEGIGVSPFFQSAEPCEFHAEFEAGGAEYRYELCATDNAVLRETLHRTKSKRVRLLEREDGRITHRVQALAGLDALRLRPNVSAIDMADQYGIAELAPVHDFFGAILSNVGYSGLMDSMVSMDRMARFLSRNDEVFAFVKSFIMECDVGVSDIAIASFTNREGRQEFFPQFVHRSDGAAHAVGDSMESSGTRALFKSLATYKLALDRGGVLVVDEFDLNLHPHILPKLLRLFLEPESNPHHAQLVFSTHDSELMNLLGRYRVCLVAKEENESFAYRLDEIPGDILRNDRPIRPAYLDGKIGGVPKL